MSNSVLPFVAAVLTSLVLPLTAQAQAVAEASPASPPSAVQPSGPTPVVEAGVAVSPGARALQLSRPTSIAEYDDRIREEKLAAHRASADETSAAYANVNLLRRWRSEDVTMHSPVMFGVGLPLAVLGVVATGVSIGLIIARDAGMSGGFLNYRAIGLGMLGPSALLLGGGLALTIGGAWPGMREAPKAADSVSVTSLRVRLSPFGAIGVF